MDDILGYRILNRSGQLPEDGWYHIAPEGEFPHPDAGVQVLDPRAFDAMVQAFQKDKAKQGDHWPGLLVDFDHFSGDTDKSSEAAGWIEDLQSRVDQADPKDNGLWAKIDWSDVGEAKVKGKRFRLVSPVWRPRDCQKLAGGRVRPLRLDSLALTNAPNMKGMTPLTNRSELHENSEEEKVPVAAQRAAGKKKAPARLFGNRSRYISFDGERIPVAADKRRSVRNAA